MSVKVCKDCKRELPGTLEYFYKKQEAKSGLDPRCKECYGRSFKVPLVQAKPGHKICTKCKRELPETLEYFYKYSKGKLGLNPHCKECYGRNFGLLVEAKSGYKICTKCGKELPGTLEYFHRNKGCGLDLAPRCKECTALDRQIHLEQNRESINRKSRERYTINYAFKIWTPPPQGSRKICSECKRELPAILKYFNKDKTGKLGLSPRCRECQGYALRIEVKSGHKICSKCRRELPSTLKYFHGAKARVDGLISNCKECLGHAFKMPYVPSTPKMGYQICTGCGRELLATVVYFRRDKTEKLGLYRRCKECCGSRFTHLVKQGYKKCYECRRELPATTAYFTKDRLGKLGLRYQCKQCQGGLFGFKVIPQEGYKICAKCKKELPATIEYFYRKTVKCLESQCKGCLKLNRRLRNAIGQSLKGQKNGHHWEDLVGWVLDDLQAQFEEQFKATPPHIRYGKMSWDNHGKGPGKWHIDHIIPINVFNFGRPKDIDFKRCWALSNLRPLWSEENLKKSDKIEKPFQPSLAMGY